MYQRPGLHQQPEPLRTLSSNLLTRYLAPILAVLNQLTDAANS